MHGFVTYGRKLIWNLMGKSLNISMEEKKNKLWTRLCTFQKVLFLPKIETEDLQKDKIIYLKQSISQRGSREAISFLALWQ